MDRASCRRSLRKNGAPVVAVTISGDDIEKVTCSRLLGRGGFGSVYLARINERPVAIKRFHSCIRNALAREESFRAESRIAKLSHPNIVGVLASTTVSAPGGGVIIMEYAGACDLQKVINDAERPLDVRTRISYTLDVARALDYVHGHRLVHLDVKPANIIVSEQNVCKLADFGCSQETTTDTGSVSPTSRSRLTGTYAYRAPELLRGRPASTKSDIYALGVTMWQMLAVEPPYKGMPYEPVVFAVVASRLRPTLPTDVDELCADDPVEQLYIRLYERCWHHEPSARPSASCLTGVASLWNASLLAYCQPEPLPNSPRSAESLNGALDYN